MVTAKHDQVLKNQKLFDWLTNHYYTNNEVHF